ncbi:acetyl esterase [Amycolatopsis bartoniae]|uniref:Esterase n=1 Tax=Amycolatopsis bartoniae TaxID=941986 RepID=A0A8H9IUY9_9PSEU|nr:alpha/beta hydrolase [Amycolatopsis bartoniae]MBB2939711.1 acetyl esterase [Amycolatopsis bartoniae]TVT06170.1 alpha/beta hydrolase [Amycolatopsis bartoniae]GHF36334.1 esterase [Amycolatopsis bartoniae]
MALDEATTMFLAQMAGSGRKPIHEMEPGEARESGPMMIQLYGPGPDMARVVNERLNTTDGNDFAVRVLVPSAAPAGLVVYYHGGGWVLGDIDQFDTLGRQLAARTGCAVVLVDYRKAPEHPYPAAVEDAWQALNWAHEQMTGIAGATVPLIVAGDSAGGNLAAVMAHRARDRSGPDLALQVLVYPVTAADFDTASYLAPENQLMLSRDSMIWFWNHYAAPGRRGETEASPLRAPDFTGLPPAVVLVAEHDPLRDEGEAYAAALEAAGVPVRKRLFDAQMHGFFSMVNVLPGSAAAMDYVAGEITAVTGAGVMR